MVKSMAELEAVVAEVARSDPWLRDNPVTVTWPGGQFASGAYTEADRPLYGEVGHGPWCLGLPNPPVPTGFVPLRNGTKLDEPGRH